MNYMKIVPEDLTNGEGLRLSLFVTGCSHGCKGCYNESAWNPKSGIPFTKETLRDVLKALKDHDGLSLLGGDPLYPRNLEVILEICREAKRLYPEKDIWCWTGYLISELSPYQREVLKYVDVLIDGPYECDKPTTLPWRGSWNQTLIKIKNLL